MKSLNDYILETKKLSFADDYIQEGFKFGKNQMTNKTDEIFNIIITNFELDTPNCGLSKKFLEDNDYDELTKSLKKFIENNDIDYDKLVFYCDKKRKGVGSVSDKVYKNFCTDHAEMSWIRDKTLFKWKCPDKEIIYLKDSLLISGSSEQKWIAKEGPYGGIIFVSWYGEKHMNRI